MTEEWIFYDDLRKKYQYPRGKIIDLLRKGLQPYNLNDQESYCPEDYHGYFYYYKLLKSYPGQDGDRHITEENEEGIHIPKEGIHIPPEDLKRLEIRAEIRADLLKIVEADPNVENNLDQLSWKFVWVPKDTAESEKLFSILKNTKFKKEEFEKLLDKIPSSPLIEPSHKAKNKETKQAVVENQDYSFVFQGVVWSVTYEGKTRQLTNNERIKYIAYLLDNPNNPFKPEELYALIASKGVPADLPKTKVKNDIQDDSFEDHFEEGGYNDSEYFENEKTESYGDEKTENEKYLLNKIVHETFKDLQNAQNEGDDSKIKEIEKKWKEINAYIKSHGGIISIKNNRVVIKYTDLSPKYKAVYAQIKKAKDQISEEDLPELAKHLNEYIDVFCYRPPPDHPKWDVIF